MNEFVYEHTTVRWKALNVTASMHVLLQILAITLFENMPLQQVHQALDTPAVADSNPKLLNQLNLFDSLPDSNQFNTIKPGAL